MCPQDVPLKRKNVCAFSLIELLVVIAIIAMMAGLAVTAFNSIGQARGAAEAAEKIAAAIEFARSEAVARGTYVWMGIDQQTNFGNLDLRLGIVCSKDGTPNFAVDNLNPLGRPQLIERTAIAPLQQINVGTHSLIPSDSLDLSTANQGILFQIGSTSFLNRRTITFSPLGEVSASPAPAWAEAFQPFLAIGLRQARGTNLATNADIAVVLDGSSGLAAIIQK